MNASSTTTATDLEALEVRFARKLTASLDQLSVPHDIEQRLRISREIAVTRARSARAFAAQRQRASGVAMAGSGQAVINGGSPDRAPWWVGTTLFALVVLLAVGLMAIEYRNDEMQIEAAAEIDAALLADDLPPNAYSDAGFREFLRMPPAADVNSN